jgi:hypothetical protein
MKQTHDCQYLDIAFNPMMKRWECIECRKIFTGKERKAMKSTFLSVVSIMVR